MGDFPTVVRRVVAAVLEREDLPPDKFLRSFSVALTARHWVGRDLHVYRSQLDGALDAWQRLDAARGGLHLFTGGRVNVNYTPERAAALWRRLRDTYIALR